MISATTNFQTALAAYTDGPIIKIITIAGYSRVFTNFPTGVSGQVDWLETIDDYTYTVHDLDGGADQGSLSFTVQDNNGSITGDFPGFTFEGKQITIKVGFAGLAQADFMTIFTGYIDSVASANSNNDYYFTCSDVSSKLAQVVYTIGNDGLTGVSSSNPKTLNAHPLDILLSILGTQIGLSGSLYDSTKIQAYRDGIFSGMQFTFNLTTAPAAADFIKNQLLKPLGGYLWVNAAGQITVNFFYPIATVTPAGTLDKDILTAIPEAEQLDMINTVQFQFDKADGAGGNGSYMSQDTETFAPSVSKYAQYAEQVVQADGLRSNFQGFFVAKMVSRMIFGRYGLKNLKFDQAAPPCRWQAIRYEPGDVVQVTHASIPDRAAGVIGITNKLFEVIDKSINFTEGQVTLTMIDASYLSGFGTFLIAPTGEARYPASPSAPVMTTVASGSLGSATEFYRLTYNTAAGETLAGAEASIVRGANTVVRITSPIPSSAVISYNVYGGSSSGSETKQNATPILIGVNWTEPTTGLISGAAMPVSDTSGSASSVDKAKYMFLCTDSDKYSNNDAAHVLG